MTTIVVRRRADTIKQQSDELTRIRNELEQADVTVDGIAFQAREVPDLTRMRGALARWDAITLTKDDEGRLLWKASDNTKHAFTREEFEAFVNYVEELRSIRSDHLFAYSELLKAQLPLPDDHPALKGEGWPVDALN